MKLRDWLKKQRIPVASFAQVLNVHVNHLYQILGGTRYAGYALAKHIQALTDGEVTIDELVKPTDPIPPLRCPTCGAKLHKDKKDLG